MGRALVEACLAARPIVAYDYDWQREIIRHEMTGMLVSNGDWQKMCRAALWLLDHPASAQHLGKAARKSALEMMCPEKLLEAEVKAYERLFRPAQNAASPEKTGFARDGEKIAVTHLLPGLKKGGAERVAIELANSAAQEGHDVTLAFAHPEANATLVSLCHPRLRLGKMGCLQEHAIYRVLNGFLWVWR